MYINEAARETNLTKKAIEYYTEKELVIPAILDNGYRDYCEGDIDLLKKIAVLRRLGLGTDDVREVLADQTGAALQKLSVRKKLSVQRELARKAILDKLSCGRDYREIQAELEAAEQSATVAEKLLEAFPGYYGRFICLHFARFLNEPIATAEQQAAYREIIDFLDHVPSLSFPDDVRDYLQESTRHMGAEDISEMLEKTKESIENPEKFLAENKDVFERYLEYKRTDEYKNSPPHTLQVLLTSFNQTSGYYDRFIPAMIKLSASYAEYYRQIETANEKFLAMYPEMEKRST